MIIWKNNKYQYPLKRSSFCFVTPLFIVLSWSIFALTTATATANYKDKRILVLHSYEPSFPTYERRMQGVQSVFANSLATVDVEYMDSKRHFDEKSQQLFFELFKQKLNDRPAYDVIITNDDNALALEKREELFKQVPIVFTGLNNEKLARGNQRHQKMW